MDRRPARPPVPAGTLFAGTVLAGVLLAVLLAWVSSSPEVHLWHESTLAPSSDARGGGTATVPTVTAATIPTFPDADPTQARWHMPAWVGSIVRLLIVLLVVRAVIGVWRRRPRWAGSGGGPVPQPHHHEPEIVLTEELAADADATVAALRDGAPRTAIAACWLRLEDAVGRTGLRRTPSDTSTEFARKVLASSSADAAAVDVLAALFREARFSTHPLGEEERGAALAALQRIHRSLGIEDMVGV